MYDRRIDARRSERIADLPLLFTLAILLSAALLFLVEPMFARLVLPRLGGSPAVWNTAMLFYQVVLLAGYAYAHLVTARLRARRQAALHAAVLLVPFLVLPLGIPPRWVPPVERSPIPWLLALMLVRVGPPFAVLSATSPLLQSWFARTGHRAARDPYCLYAASNVGSLLGLLSYPFLIEPRLRLGAQSALWEAGYGLAALLLLGCAAVAWRSVKGPSAEPGGLQDPAVALEAEPITRRRRALWVLRAFVPSSLMLSVTTYLSTNLTPFPLLWVLPLALYLLSFVIAFAVRARFFLRLLPFALAITLVPLGGAMAGVLQVPLWAMVSLHLLTFFAAALACHGALAADRPAPQHLTGFYLWLSAGGALGGAFNALLAPLLFTAIEEYPLGLVLACLAMPALAAGRSRRLARLFDLAVPVAVGGLSLGLFALTPSLQLPAPWIEPALRFGLPVVLCLLFLPRPVRFGLGIAALLAVNIWRVGLWERPLYVERSFFGISRVTVDEELQRHFLMHGDTLHGAQSLEPGRRCQALTYYYASGPIGQVLTEWLGGRERIAVVGLGTGSLAAYSQPGQRWTFYEIDPAVARIAGDPRYFTYLSDCAPDARIVLGDARLSLAGETGQYDLIVLDAYSSDAIPVHLITREALAMYLERLAPGGLLAFHISNRYVDLEPVLSALAEDAGLVATIRNDFTVTTDEKAAGKSTSRWIVLVRLPEDLGPLARDSRWGPLQPRAGLAPWTDDYSSVVSVLRWR
jgi:hypothetical protein